MSGFFAGYLFGWTFWLCVSLGCLALLLLHHVFRAEWGRAVLPALEAGAKTLPLMMILFAPVLLGGMAELYPWFRPEDAGDMAQHRGAYLNMPFFAARFAAYFVVWIGLAVFLTASSRRHLSSAVAEQMRTNVSAPGLALFVLTVTFAVTDWVMSTEQQWSSTIFGVWFITGQALSAVALAALWYAGRGGVAPRVLRDLGNLMLAFTLMWAYISLSQYLIIWSGNLPEEASFYLRRSHEGWQALGLLLIIGQFLVPFLALLSGKTKRSPSGLALVALWTLLMRAVDVYWIVSPSVRPGGALPSLFDLLAFGALGGLWLAAFARGLRPTRTARAAIGGAPAHV